MTQLSAIIRRLMALLKLSVEKLVLSKNIKFNLVELISLSTIIKVGRDGKIFLGRKVGTRRNVEFSVGNKGVLDIGSNCFFNNNCIVAVHEKVVIQENCSFGPNVAIYDHDHDFKVPGGLKSGKFKSAPIKIGKNVWIGANTVILRGSEIGDNTVIAAGTIVKGIYPHNSIVFNERIIKEKRYDYQDE